METYPVAWGLDIGHTSIKAVKLHRQGDAVSVLGYSIEPIQSGEDVDREDAVIKALQTLAMREEMRGTPVFAALSGRQIFSRTINVPVINPKKVDKMVELEARQQIPGNFDEVRWHYHLSPAHDGVSNDVALFAARKEIVDDLISKCNRAGIDLVGISVSSLAVYNFVRYDQDFESDESVVVLDIGAENTDLVVYQGDALWMRPIGVSGNDITRAFMKKFRVSFEEAETLKCQVGDSRQVERILKVVEPSLAELVSDVQRSLGFYKSKNSDAKFENVVVSGNTFKLPGLTQFMADRLGYAIIELVEMERIDVDPNLDRAHFLEDLQSLGVAMGLGLQAIGSSHANVNLLPSSKRLETLLRQKRWAAVVMLALIFVSWLVGYMVQAHHLEQNLLIAQKIEKQHAANEDRAKETVAEAQRLIPKAKEIKVYENYGAHAGLLHQVEESIFQAVATVASDREGYIADIEQLGDDPLQENEDPVLQPVYLESLNIPNLEIDRRTTPFDQLDRRGGEATVRLQVRIPAQADVSKVRDGLKALLEQIRLSDVVWRARNPGDDLPPLEERPVLFSEVKAPSQGRKSERWVYHDDHFHYFEPEEHYGPKTVTHNQSYYLITYECSLEPAR